MIVIHSRRRTVPADPILVLPVLLAALLHAGCKGDSASPPAGKPTGEAGTQTFVQAMQVVCDAPNDPDLPAESTGLANRTMAMATAIDQRVQNMEVRQLMGGIGRQTSEQKIRALREGARRAGVEPCALATTWSDAMAGRSTAPDPSETSESTALDPPPLPSEPKTYDEAIAILCSAPPAATDTPAPAPTGGSAGASRTEPTVSDPVPDVRGKLSNPEAEALLASLATATAPERVSLLRAAATRTALPTCALADAWDTGSSQPPR